MDKKNKGGAPPEENELNKEQNERPCEADAPCETADEIGSAAGIDNSGEIEKTDGAGQCGCEPVQGSERAGDDGDRPPECGEEPDECKRLACELEQTKDRLLRTAAEYDNYRKRTEREKAAAVTLGEALVLEKLLPALDTLEMAAGAECADAEYKKGVEMTAEVFKKSLGDIGVTEIEAEGRMFDPALHNAVSREESELESGAVTKVLQKGYKLGERVIRHAIVAVAE